MQLSDTVPLNNGLLVSQLISVQGQHTLFITVFTVLHVFRDNCIQLSMLINLRANTKTTFLYLLLNLLGNCNCLSGSTAGIKYSIQCILYFPHSLTVRILICFMLMRRPYITVFNSKNPKYISTSSFCISITGLWFSLENCVQLYYVN